MTVLIITPLMRVAGQSSDKNQMFLILPVLKPTFNWRSGCASAWAYGSKEGIIFRLFSARLKPCPDENKVGLQILRKAHGEGCTRQ